MGARQGSYQKRVSPATGKWWDGARELITPGPELQIMAVEPQITAW